MQKKIKLFCLIGLFVLPNVCLAMDDDFDDVDISSDSIEMYDVQGSLFQQITDLEQEKVLMALEKERAQLDLELDRLAAEKIKLHMEIDGLSGRAEQQQKQLETEKAKLEAEAARIELQKAELEKNGRDLESKQIVDSGSDVQNINKKMSSGDIAKEYKLLNVMGAGAQLQATLQDLQTGQTKRVNVGKKLDDYTIKSISLEDGVVFVKDGVIQVLNIGNKK